MAYKVFCVEDEIVTREGIRDSVDWASAGFRWCGEAPDGEIALSLIEAEKPDILITDIKMPFMDGLELSRIVRQRLPQTRIVILSGHDEFRYAQEAIQLGVTEYLLKPVSAYQLLEALAKIRDQIDCERQQQEQMRHLQDQVNDNVTVMRQRFLVDLVTGRLSAPAAVDEARRVHVDLVARCYLAMIVRCEVTAELTHLARLEAYHSVRQRAADLLCERKEMLVFTKDVEETGVIVKGDTSAGLQATVETITEQISRLFPNQPGLTVGVGAGRPVERLAALPQSFLDACDAAKSRTKKGASNHKGVVFPPKQLLALDPTAVITFLRRGDLSGVERFLDVYLHGVHSGDPDLSMIADFLATDLLVAVASFVHELGGSLDEVIPQRAELEQLLAASASSEGLRALMRRFLSQALAYRDQRTDHPRQLIEQAKNYIETHYTSDELSLHAVAAQVGWSPSHFSTVFSRATGETFIEYLTRQRMQKAKELLRMTSLPTVEVAYRVGYSNPRYFYAVFKKATGQSPTEFRQDTSSKAHTSAQV
jgi:two-component system response regulator YesN